ncbi:hypothetical protein PVAP13_3KG435200 [Panicum virgatum]|uniref:Uncharacterized protein n=1 Tax=Panicum virgatum TaxID=38727 RepID=A0A8T0V2B2_PANVG|nr:hypothetical protein PVAP13_3KG435200 [Panicum virgatum]KAG2629278.1 hypothetical protein PVAP13_3KG435200 [Panicum virgatum]KAG2629279.1 hypothetical protein PVAP13_3KG435200 [Panicum virgatum]KAG2629280.1 hypothetical protein PVAP13_3KG435200 [Panicum virgatum]KAG2629281.1 hypothetical protein PVAP13_3KG435200 [Panicum virgatum]
MFSMRRKPEERAAWGKNRETPRAWEGSSATGGRGRSHQPAHPIRLVSRSPLPVFCTRFAATTSPTTSPHVPTPNRPAPAKPKYPPLPAPNPSAPSLSRRRSPPPPSSRPGAGPSPRCCSPPSRARLLRRCSPPPRPHFFWPAPSPSQRRTNLPIRQRRMRGRTAPSDCGLHVAHRLLHRRRLMPKSTRRRSGRGRCHPRRASFRLPELHTSPSHAAAGQGATLLAIGSPTKADGGHTLTSRRRRQRVETARQPSTTADGGRGLRVSHAARPSWR